MNHSSRLLHRALHLPRITPERAARLLLALAPLVYFFSAVRGGLALCPDDCAVQNLPYRVLVARIILDGDLPLWNPYIFGGMPLHAAAQGGVLFPLNWLFILFPALMAINLVVIMAYALAGVGAYLYARQTGVCVFGACVTGLVWQWSGFLIGQTGHTNIVQAASLLPWLLWAIDAYAESGRRSRAVMIALVIALQVFAGHPQTVVFSILLAGAYALYLALTARKNRRRRLYFQSLILMPAGVALAAAQILPTLELTRHSARAATTYEFFSSYSLPPELLSLFIAPYLYGGGDGKLFRAGYVGADFYGEYVGYVGLATLALAVIALLIKPDGLTKFWGIAFLGSLALALGGFLPFDLYRLVYYVPVLNLFRTPARHLMEVDFALAVLAGRAVAVITRTRHETRTLVVTLVVALILVALSVLTVTWLRPLDFRLGREASVTLLRAPELFLPIVLATLSLLALYRFARGRGGASLLLLAIIIVDLGLWGQSSGWRRSPSRDDVLFARELPSVTFLRQHADQPGRILSLSQSLDAALSTTPNAIATVGSSLSAQPDIYMMHGVENAAGFDGFGLARYSRLADDMKLWGAPGAPARSLREGREFDLLNVRYLIAPRSPEDSPPPPPLPPLVATRNYGGHLFAEPQLGLPEMTPSLRASFIIPNVPTDKLALITTLSHSASVADGETIGRVRLKTIDGRTFGFALRAGIDTSEWAHERADVNAVIRHGRATIAESWSMEESAERYDAHNYMTAFNLPEKAIIIGGEIEAAPLPHAPQLSLNLIRMSLVESSKSASVPLHRESFNLLSAQATHTSRDADSSAAHDERWRKVAQTGDAIIYENLRALPRAWLATEAVPVTDEVALETIRTGRLPNGDGWNPHRTALVDSGFGANSAGGEIEREAAITSYAPNRIDIRASSAAPAILVLGENHYPGWRATINGQPAEIMQVNYNLRGIQLPPGKHEVSFTYRPRSVLLGCLLSIITALALLIWMLFGRLNGKRQADLCP